jgi:hypothetical protein
VGLTYANGAYDLNDKLKESLHEQGYAVTDDFVWPVGLTLNPRVEFPCGFGVGAAFGPTEFIEVKREGCDDDLSYILPVGAYLQYSLRRDRDVSPYVRVGFRYPFTGGDFLKDGTVGPFGAVGVEFLRQKRIAFGVEVGYDASEVKVTAGAGRADKKIKPIGFNASLFVLF